MRGHWCMRRTATEGQKTPRQFCRFVRYEGGTKMNRGKKARKQPHVYGIHQRSSRHVVCPPDGSGGSRCGLFATSSIEVARYGYITTYLPCAWKVNLAVDGTCKSLHPGNETTERQASAQRMYAAVPQGNEGIDIKEGSKFNIVEENYCTGQKDPESACEIKAKGFLKIWGGPRGWLQQVSRRSSNVFDNHRFCAGPPRVSSLDTCASCFCGLESVRMSIHVV